MTQEIGLYRIGINTFPLQCIVTVLLVGQEVIYRTFDTACIFTFCGPYSIINLDGGSVNTFFLMFLCLHEDLLCAEVFRNIFGIVGLWPIKLVCSLKLMGGIFSWKGCMFSLQ